MPTYYVDPSGLFGAWGGHGIPHGINPITGTPIGRPKPKPKRWPIDDLRDLFPDSDVDDIIDDLTDIQDQIKGCGGTVRFGDGCKCDKADNMVEDGLRDNPDWDYNHQQHPGLGWIFNDGDHNWAG